jgi:hypothetical protein
MAESDARSACRGLPDIFVEVEIPSEEALEDFVSGQIQDFEGWSTRKVKSRFASRKIQRRQEFPDG